MYEIFTKTKIKPICISKIRYIYSEEEWSFIFAPSFNITKDSSLQCFQYRTVPEFKQRILYFLNEY